MRSVLPVAVILAVATSSEIEINPCCPLGQIYTLVGENQTEAGCKLYEGEFPPFIAEWSSGQERAVEFKAGTGEKFRCKGSLLPVSIRNVYGPVEVRINESTGGLQLADNGTDIEVYSNEDFCGFYTDLFSEDGHLDYTYTVCYDQETTGEKEQKKFTGIFYPSAILVSAFFTLLTLVFYLTVGTIRKTLFSKITIGFLLNVFLCYLMLGISYYFELSSDYNNTFLGSLACKIIGYFVHHTFIAFFFWMTAMAFNIAKSLSAMKVVRNKNSSLKSFLVYFLYAQGIPTLFSIFIALMDTFRPIIFIENINVPLPNMGEYSCFVGSEYDTAKSFFETSVFLYFYLIVIVLITFNLICFLVTAFNLNRHWHQMQRVQTSCADGLTEHFSIIIKLSVIMGVPWILDVLSAGLSYQFGAKTFTLRVVLDILNLMTGILIFLSLICKPSVWKQIKESYCGKLEKTSLQVTKSNSSTTTNTSYKTASTTRQASPVRSV